MLKYLQSKDIECMPGSTILYLVVRARVLYNKDKLHVGMLFTGLQSTEMRDQCYH